MKVGFGMIDLSDKPQDRRLTDMTNHDLSGTKYSRNDLTRYYKDLGLDQRYMPMMVKCKNPKCGAVHPSTIQMDESAFKTSNFYNDSEECPKCGKMSTYTKPDYFFR